MSIATGLIAKLLLAISVVPAAGYGGYCAYDHYNPTFHNRITRDGYVFFPISGDMGSSEDFSKNRGEVFKALGGDWRCTKQLFTEITTPSVDNERNKEEGGTIPEAPAVNTSSGEDSVGCLVADLGHVTDTSKKAGFLKWELALRSGDRGFIYVGYFSIGKSKYTQTGASGSQTSNSTNVTSFSIVFEVAKESETWNIKNGLSWTDYFTTTQEGDGSPVSTVSNFKDVEINVSLADKHKWSSKGQICSLDNSEGEGCGNANQWEFQRYVGFWEQNDKEDGKQVIDAIKIAAKGNNQQTEHLHDIWSQTGFDFSASTQVLENKPAWNGSISSIYDVKTGKWKGTSVSNPPNATDYLKAIYSPWANKKGTWMEAEGVCYESNNRHLDKESEEAKRLTKFCYKAK